MKLWTIRAAAGAAAAIAATITLQFVIGLNALHAAPQVQPRQGGMGSGMGMGPSMMRSQPAWKGYYDAHKDTYLSTDVSSKAMAGDMHITYAPGLAHAAMASTAPMYLVPGRAAAHQIAVFGSQPGETDYSPLWHEVIVTWKSSVKPVLLTSDNQIFALQKKGKLTLKQNHVVLNCPIIKWKKG